MKSKKPKRRWQSEGQILKAIDRVFKRRFRHLSDCENKGLHKMMRDRAERLARVAEAELNKLRDQLAIFRTDTLHFDDPKLREHSIPR